MGNPGDADLAVRIVEDGGAADRSVYVVNQQVVAGTPAPGDVPVVQADGTLAWGAPSGTSGPPFDQPVFVIEGTDNTVDHLAAIVAPAGFGDNTEGNGDLLQLTDDQGNVIFHVDIYGDAYMEAPSGTSGFQMSITDADHPSQAIHMNTQSGVTIAVADGQSPLSVGTESGALWTFYPDGGIRSGGANTLAIYTAADVPDDATGANGDWTLSRNGHLYFKTGGAWTEKV